MNTSNSRAEYMRNWRKKNPEKKKKYADAWRSKNTDKISEYNHRQYLRRKALKDSQKEIKP